MNKFIKFLYKYFIYSKESNEFIDAKNHEIRQTLYVAKHIKEYL